MLETAVILLIAMVLCTLVGTLYCHVLTPETAEDTWAVVRGAGSGSGLEQRVRNLMWLRACGLLHCRVILVDRGLDADGRRLAVHLARRWPELEIWSKDET